MKRNILLMILAGFSLFLYAQKTSLRKLSGDVRQAVTENRAQHLTRGLSHSCKPRTIMAFIRIEEQQADDLLHKYGCRKYAQWGDIVIASIPLGKVEALATERAVSRIEASRRMTTTMDTTTSIINALPVYESSTNHPAYTGAGVVGGVVDVGFDLTHPNYYDTSASQYRVGAFWDQLSKDTVGSPLPVGRDVVGHAEVLAYGQSADAPTQTHGTHTSGIAVGGGYDTNFRGVAFESDICLVGNLVSDNAEYVDSADLYKFSTATDALGMKYCFDYARQQGKPCVVSFSEGYNPYLDEEDSLFAATLQNLSGPGRIIVASAGNESIEKTYFEKPADKKEAGAFIRCFKENASYRFISDTSLRLLLYYYKGEKGIPTDTLSFATEEVPYDTIMSKRMICEEDTLTLYIYRGRSFFVEDDVYEILVSGNRTLDTFPPMALVVQGEGLIQFYGGSKMAFTSRNTDKRWSAAQTGHNVIAPGCFPSVICVGSTSHRLKILNEQGNTLGALAGSTAGLISPFSSTGPSMNRLLKPDVVAPGVNIVSSFSHIYHPEEDIISWSDFQGERYPWAAFSGTSMSTPVVAGVIALWLQAKPDLTPDEIRQVLQTSCRQPDTSLTYPNQVYGYGEIDAYQGLLKILEMTKIEGISMHQPQSVQVRPWGGGVQLVFDEVPEEPFTVRVYALSGSCVYRERLKVCATEVSIDLPSADRGVYVVQVDSSNQKIQGSCLVRL